MVIPEKELSFGGGGGLNPFQWEIAETELWSQQWQKRVRMYLLTSDEENKKDCELKK